MIVKKDFWYAPDLSNRTLHIWLPEDYESSEECYPVMYFFDGHNLFCDQDATYGKSWGMGDFLCRWPKPMIVVGAECNHEKNGRLSEYLPYPARWELESTLPLGEATMAWLMEQVKPMIDAEFRTIPFRECTGIGGSSMGGLMAAFAALRWNALISKAACLSPALGFCAPPLFQELKNRAIEPDTRLYFSWGTKEMARWPKAAKLIDETAERFAARGAKVSLFHQPGGRHCEADWEKLVPDFMKALWDD